MPEADVKPAALKPGQSTYITARVDTNKVGGQFEKSIHIFSNDPENKDVAWQVKGKVMDVAAELALPPQGDDGKASPVSKYGASFAATDAKVAMVFYTPGCRECGEIMEKILPQVKEKYSDKILIVDYNMDNMESYAFLLSLEDRYDERAKNGFYNPSPPIIFIEDTLLYGAKEIKEKLEQLIEQP